MVAICLAIAGCRTDVTVEVYSSDLRAVTADTPLSTAGTMAIQIPSASECDKYTAQIVAIMKGVVDKFMPQGCKSVGMDSFLMAEISVPVVVDPDWKGGNKLFELLVAVADDHPDLRGRIVIVGLNRDKYEILSKRMRKEFHQKLDLAKSKLTILLRNDERQDARFQVDMVFVDGQPRNMQTLNLKRRGVARIELSNVHAAFLEKEGSTSAFLLMAH